MTHVAVSVLNFNSSEATIACVRSILAVKTTNDSAHKLSIFVADNHSDKSQRKLLMPLADYPEITVNLHAKNIGFSAGHNLNIETIFEDGAPDFIWVLNNDCVVEKDTLNSLLRGAKERPDVAIWGASILDTSGNTVQCAGGCFYNSWLSTYKQYGNNHPLSALSKLKNSHFDYMSGASLFFPTKLIQQGFMPTGNGQAITVSSGLFNEGFFLYFEELDLAKRLKPEYKMAWCKDAIIRHAGGVSTGTDSGQRSEIAEYHSSLSALKFTRLYYPRRLWAMAPLRYMLKCVQLTLNGKPSLIKPLTQAYRDFWLQ